MRGDLIQLTTAFGTEFSWKKKKIPNLSVVSGMTLVSPHLQLRGWWGLINIKPWHKVVGIQLRTAISVVEFLVALLHVTHLNYSSTSSLSRESE